MYVLLDKNQYVTGLSSQSKLSDDWIEISAQKFWEIAKKEDKQCYQYIEGEFILDLEKQTSEKTQRETMMQLDNLRARREAECFSLINQNYVIDGQSVTWFETLTDEQKVEAAVWVQEWRDVTDTLIAPEKPSWLE